jgi:PAS domain S-box-containing protein
VILLSAHGYIDQAVEAMQQGAHDFVLKPVEFNDLDTRLQKAIERQDLHKRLIRSEQNLELLTQNIPDIFYSLDTKGNFINITPSVQIILGYQPDEMLGNNVFKYIHAADQGRIRESFIQGMQDGDSTIKRIAFRMYTKDGQIRQVEVNRRTIFEDGHPVRQDGIARDITERLQLQEELEKKSVELEARVKERTERLEYSNLQLAALNAVSNRFSLIYSEKELIEEAPKLLSNTLDFDRAILLMPEHGELQLKSFCLAKDPPELVQSFLDRIESKKSVIPPHFTESYEENKTIFIADLNSDKRWPREKDQIIRTKAVVIAPIKVDKKPHGLLVGNMQHHDREMDKQDVARFEMFANMVGLALTNIRAYQSLEAKVSEQTQALRTAYSELEQKAKQTEKTSYALGNANIKLLAIQEELESKNQEMQALLQTLTESEDALKKERNFVSATLDTAGALVIVLDTQGRIVRFNRACEETTGFKFKNVKGKPFWDILLMPEETTQVRAVFKQLLAGDFPNQQENYWRSKKNGARLIAWSNTALLDNKGNIEYIIGTGIDITERRISEAKLATRLRYEEGLAACSQALLYGTDNHGNLNVALKYLLKAADAGRVYIFENFEDERDGLCMRQTYEACADDVEPQQDNPILKHAPYKEGFSSWAEILAKGQPVKGTIRNFPKQQRAILEPQGILSILVLPITVGGKWFGFIGFDDVKREREWSEEDIRLLQTAAEMLGGYIEHIEAESALQESLKELAETNRNLRETQGQLVQSEKMASLGMLVAGIAHEINTPVGAIHSMHDTLKRAVDKLKSALEADFQEALELHRGLSSSLKIIEDANRVISSGSERVANIVRRLKSFARLDEAELKNVDIHEGIEDTLTLIHHEIKHSITIKKEYGELPPIPCFPGRLNQVYLNLLINAKQAIPDRGEITIRTYAKDQRIYIEFSDNGVGIPQQKLDKIFDPGFTTKGVGVGTGLGLSIVYQIIQDHRGEIKVTSELHKGTNFTIILRSNLDEILAK